MAVAGTKPLAPPGDSCVYTVGAGSLRAETSNTFSVTVSKVRTGEAINASVVVEAVENRVPSVAIDAFLNFVDKLRPGYATDEKQNRNKKLLLEGFATFAADARRRMSEEISVNLEDGTTA
ncbi:hypothetical protein, partial [uncultured Salinisphaera sp.]|uniref:hypothetical protein n=1 Tax=uncultured Salinisphaera sp. TaxID=359372 RepID=UPI0032B1E021